MEIIIGKIDLYTTVNGNPKAIVFPQGTNFNNNSEGIEIIGENEVLYLSTRKVGEKINVITKGKWHNIDIPQEYVNAVNSPSYERVKILFKRAIASINLVLNGPRPLIDQNTANTLLVENIESYLNFQNTTIKTLKDSNTDFAKHIVKDVKSENTQERTNAYNLINELTYRNLHEIQKEYNIVYECNETKNK